MQDKMSFVLTYELKQETPIIHFQHNQSGATLRATEVKPKLDRFIIKKLGGVKNISKDWFVKDTEALNYKMQISATGEPKRSKSIEFMIEAHEMYSKANRLDPKQGDELKKQAKILEKKSKKEINEMYFGNMVSQKSGDFENEVRKSYKETLFFEAPLELRIVCIIKELRSIIDKYIVEFFLVHNFGTRQSKGFGGFSVITENRINPTNVLKENGYKFFYAQILGVRPEYDKMLNHAKNIYAVLKGGYNLTRWDEKSKSYKFPRNYIKGYIQRQFINEIEGESVGSDKALIKSKKKYKKDRYTGKQYDYPSNRKGQPSEFLYERYLFVRAMLGLADHYEFKDEAREGNVEIFSLGENSFDVERFKSPVTIKIVGNYLIFIVGSFAEICGKTFYLSPNGYPEYIMKNENHSEKNYAEKKKNIENSDFFVAVKTLDKFDEDDIGLFIEDFVEYFKNERSKLGNFGGDIAASKDINLIAEV